MNAAKWLLDELVASGLIASHASRVAAIHLIFAIGAILVGAAVFVRTWGTAYL